MKLNKLVTNRRDAIKLALGTAATGVVGALTLPALMEPDPIAKKEPRKLVPSDADAHYKYTTLDPAQASELAYLSYKKDSCMYAVFHSIITQLSERVGEPFASIPTFMMRYGHGGIAGYGTTCGTLNAAAAVMGLLIENKADRDALITDLFRWYEQTPMPTFVPKKADYEYTPPTATVGSPLCHASISKWVAEAHVIAGGKERKERCKRVTADVAGQAVKMLNAFFDGKYMANQYDNENVRECLACHGPEGKLDNTTGVMDCHTCHTTSESVPLSVKKSVAHRVFGAPHHVVMKSRVTPTP